MSYEQVNTMISLYLSRTIVLTLLMSLFASAQVTSGIENINLPKVSAPFPIPANNSNVLSDGGSSTIKTGSNMATSSNTSIGSFLSASGTITPLPVASTSTILTPPLSLISTVTPVPFSSSSSLVAISSSVIVSFSASSSINASSTTPSLVIISSTGPTSNGIINTGLTMQPPGVSSTFSTSTGIQLPSGITLQPNPGMTLSPTGAEVRSSASDLSVVFVGIFPLLNNWINTPDAPRVTAVTDELKDILPKAVDLLGKFPKPTNGVELCQSGQRRRSEPEKVISSTPDRRSLFGGLFKTAFSLLNCVVETTNKVKDEVIKGTKDSMDTVKKLQDALKPMIDALNEVEESKPSGSASDKPTSTEAISSSLSSCTLQTVSNCNVRCTAIATTTMGGRQRRDKRDACTTACEAPITKCGATGVTSVSTVTSTTTASRFVCAPSCAACDNHDRGPPLGDPIVAGYSKARNGVLYIPAPTASNPLSNNIILKDKRLLPRETSLATSSHQRRALSHFKDVRVIDGITYSWTGGVGGWLRHQIAFSPNRLAHGSYIDGTITTGFTFPLENTPNNWGLVNLYGCTSVIVISRKRMYMTHIWEGPTMMEPGNMQTQALDPLRNGDQGTPGLAQFVVAGGDFEDIPENEVRAFVITPFTVPRIPNQPADNIRYRNQIDQIRALLEDILGRGDTIIIPYASTAPDDAFNHAFGKVLIQYDPVNEWSPAEGCNIQFAGVELWFEDHEEPRFRNVWTALPHQVLSPDSLIGRSLPGEDGEVQVLGDEKVPAFEDEGRKEYEALRRRQFCARPSNSASTSSASLTSSSPPPSMTQDPTTLQTSVIPSSSADSTSFSSMPTISSTPSTPPNPPPIPTPSQAISIVLKYLDKIEGVTRSNIWMFYETKYGSQADVCAGSADSDGDSEWVDSTAVQSPPWPHTSYTFILYGEHECRYFNDGKGPGSLTCPSWNGKIVDCKEHPERTQKSATYRCSNMSYHRAVTCEW